MWSFDWLSVCFGVQVGFLFGVVSGLLVSDRLRWVRVVNRRRARRQLRALS